MRRIIQVLFVAVFLMASAWMQASEDPARRWTPGDSGGPTTTLPQYATTILVRPDGTGAYPTIQAAINAAAPYTTIELADGVFTGDGNRDLDTLGKALTITSQSGDPASCIIDCQGSMPSNPHRGFNFHSGETAETVIAAITIRNGFINGTGGGINCVDASPRFIDCVITGCRANPGPAMYLLRSQATFQSCSIVGNWDYPGFGGAIQITDGSAAVFNDCVIRGNGCLDGYGSGGVRVINATVTMTNCDISGNYAMWGGKGGGIAAYSGSIVWLSDCTIADNHLEAFSNSSTPVRIATGAGVYASASQINLLRCTINGNSTRILWGPVELAGNAVSALGSSTVSMDRTIATFNWAALGNSPDQPAMIEAVYSDAGSNIPLVTCDIYGNAGGDYRGAIAGLLGVNGNISSDPLYCDAGTGDLTLDTASPCIISGGPAPPYDVMGSQAVACSTHETVPQFAQGQAISPQTGLRPAATWGDYDGDRDEDLFVVRRNAACRLYRNDGGGLFTEITGTPLGVTGPAVTATWADYDGDADLDLYVVNENAANRLFTNTGGGGFTEVVSTALAYNGPCRDAIWADFDNDADLDLYLVCNGAANRLYRNDGGEFSLASCPALEDAGPGASAAAGDIDRDGDLDVYIVNSGGTNRLVRNLGGLVFAEIAGSASAITGDARSGVWADYDKDLDLDLYVSVYNGGNRLFANDGAGALSEVAGSGAGVTGPYIGSSWLDYDRDGDVDLYVMTDGTDSAITNLLLRNDGGVFVPVSSQVLGVGAGGYAAAVADYDNDGRPDLYTADNVTGRDAVNLVHNESSDDNHWLTIALQGEESNTYGIGANVSVYADSICVAFHEIGGGSRPAVQNTLVALCGLGTTTAVDSLVVIWPGGDRQVVTNVLIDALLVVAEVEAPAPAFVEAAPRNLAEVAVTPNPFNAMVMISFEAVDAGAAPVGVFDVRGRLVRRIDSGATVGRRTVLWDGRDEHGAPAAAGAYLFRIRAADGRKLTARAMLVK